MEAHKDLQERTLRGRRDSLHVERGEMAGGGGAVRGKDIPEGTVWEPPFAREMEHLIV